MPELEQLLDELKSGARAKIENPAYWRHVGHVEGAAAVLLSMVLTLLPQFPSPRKQAVFARAYLSAAKEVFDKYFSDYDEDGFGTSSFSPFIELAELDDWETKSESSPAFGENARDVQLKPTAGASLTTGWSAEDLEASLVSIARAHTRPTLEIAEQLAYKLVPELTSVLESEEINSFAELSTQIGTEQDYSRSVQAALILALRGTKLLSFGGIPLHPVRYKLLKVLQLCINTHRINNPLGLLDQVALDGAISEFIARACFTDDELAEDDHFTQVRQSNAKLILSIHQGMYRVYDLAEDLNIDLSTEDDVVGAFAIELNTVFGLLAFPVCRDKTDVAAAKAIRNREVYVGAAGLAGWSLLCRSLCDLYVLQERYKEGISWLRLALEGIATLATNRIQTDGLPGRIFLETMRVSLFALASAILTQCEKTGAEVEQSDLLDIMVNMSLLRDRMRTPDLPFAGYSADSLNLQSPRSAILIYFRPLNLLALWLPFYEKNKHATSSMRGAARNVRTMKALASLEANRKENPTDDFLEKYGKAYTELEDDSDNATKLNYARYIYFYRNPLDGRISYSDLGHAAPIDRMIGDYRGVVQGLGRAERRVGMIAPKLNVVLDSGPQDEPPTDENYFIPLKAQRILANIFPTHLHDWENYLLVVPDGEIFRIPFNTVVLGAASGKSSFATISKFFTLGQILAPSTKSPTRQLSKGIVLANPVYDLESQSDQSDLALSHSIVEAQHIMRAFPSRALHGLEANKKALSSIESPLFIHFATHMVSPDGVTISNDEMAWIYGDHLFRETPETLAKQRGIGLSGLQSRHLRKVSKDDEYGNGIFSGEDFRGLDLAGTQFITLGGCDGAATTIDSADSLNGFMHDAFHKGIAFAVGSVWQLSDRHSAIFFANFYEALARGESAGAAFAESLRLARESAVTTFEWGSFDFYGDPTAQVTVGASA